MRLNPEATSVVVGGSRSEDTTLPVSGAWGTGPASATHTLTPDIVKQRGVFVYGGAHARCDLHAGQPRGRRGHPLTEQVADCHACAGREGWEVVKVFTDSDRS